MARAAATEARQYSDNVVTVYSPDATWPRVRDALAGASIVVYLGHGNGWPSRYSDVPRPRTQNGLGLNPVAGKGDRAHQYFGEQYLKRSVRLAPGAVVLLHHLCYASGAAEPGMAQPRLDVAVQRVDNYGAGWLAAGATAVIAEAHGAPAWYIRALFQRRGTVESMWRRNPNFHDHVLDFDSVRTPGARLLLDPDRKSTGFYRSIVLRVRFDDRRGGHGNGAGRTGRVGMRPPPPPRRGHPRSSSSWPTRWSPARPRRSPSPSGRVARRTCRPGSRSAPAGIPCWSMPFPRPRSPRRTTPRQQHRPIPQAHHRPVPRCHRPTPRRRHGPCRPPAPRRAIARSRGSSIARRSGSSIVRPGGRATGWSGRRYPAADPEATPSATSAAPSASPARRPPGAGEPGRHGAISFRTPRRSISWRPRRPARSS